MPPPGVPLEKLGFLTLGTYDGDDPAPGHEYLLEEIVLGEELGFDSVWLRHRHFQSGISSPVTMLAAASQRTSRIEFGTAVTPLGWENPLRYAEDLGTLDVLSGGRMNPGLSVGPPIHWDDVKGGLYPDTADLEDLTYTRVTRLLSLLRGKPASTFSGVDGIESFSDHVQPHSPGLADRVWYGGGSRRSVRWAGEQGLAMLTSNVIQSEGHDLGDDASRVFAQIQREQIELFRSVHPLGDAARVSQGLVVIPTDTATADQVARYTAYLEARTPRTAVAHGPRQMLYARDLVGTSEQIAEALYANPAFREVREVVWALPFTFEHADYVQILTDMATRLGPALGWNPGASGATGTEVAP
jgi:alkanesulfonate monooxygenase SsuD/methylene tetrahydromethanopterin reductase-like flavin-dependent oxidoreductase (luciferase family)